MEIKHNGLNLVMYDSLQDLNSFRFHVYTFYSIIDSGIGADTNAIYRRIALTIDKIDKDPSGAKQELRNMATAIQNIEENISPEMMCFCAYIKSINGKPVTNDDLDQKGLELLRKRLDQKYLPVGKIWDFLDFVKKKVSDEFNDFFPHRSGKAGLIKTYKQIKERTLLVLSNIISPTEKAQGRIKVIDQLFALSFTSSAYDGEKGQEVALIKAYERTCAIISAKGYSVDPRKMSTVQFFTALDLIKAEAKPANNGKPNKNKPALHTRPRA